MIRWAVGTLTAPRKQATLAVSLTSLRAAGFAPDVILDDVERKGCWQNWLAVLRRLLSIAPDVERYLVTEDDALFSVGLRDYLDHNPPPPDSVASLYCSRDCMLPELMRWARMPVPLMAHGSLAYVLTPTIARQIAADPPFPNRRHGTDHAVGTFCRYREIPYYVHSPSLTRHSLAESALGDEVGGRKELRHGGIFVTHVTIHEQKAIFFVDDVLQPDADLLLELAEGWQVEVRCADDAKRKSASG